MNAKVTNWDREADVVIVGSGGAGLTAAILAHDGGARVTLVERSDRIGGTTAVSGGGLIVPLHPHAPAEAGDSREKALTYCKHLTAGRTADELVEAIVDEGSRMIEYLEAHTPLRLEANTGPDYRPEAPGGLGPRGGRALSPKLFNKKALGEWENLLRPAPIFCLPLTTEEMFHTHASHVRPQELPYALLAERMQQGFVATGNALVAALLKACLDRGIDLLIETRGRELLREGGRVIGLRATRNGRDFLIRAARAVVLASGGYEWNPALVRKFLPGTITLPLTPPHNEGDGLLMAMELGADLANMSEQFGFPAAAIPGEEYDGRPLGRFTFPERNCPHSLWVNRHGERFVNEAANYNDMSKSLGLFDLESWDYRNQPAWAIMDSQYRAQYPILTCMPGDPDPSWLIKADTLEELARKASIDPVGLQRTVARFNEFAAAGRDPDFRRGESHYDRYWGDARAPHPNLGSVAHAPFHALRIQSGAIGTKGGPRTNARGQVMDVRDRVIPGLYAAGNVAANISGLGYYGGIGIGMTFGYTCGRQAANEPGH